MYYPCKLTDSNESWNNNRFSYFRFHHKWINIHLCNFLLQQTPLYVVQAKKLNCMLKAVIQYSSLQQQKVLESP